MNPIFIASWRDTEKKKKIVDLKSQPLSHLYHLPNHTKNEANIKYLKKVIENYSYRSSLLLSFLALLTS